MRRTSHPVETDSPRNPDEGGGGWRRADGLDPEPDVEPPHVARRTDDEDDTEEIDLADDDLEELSALEEELDAQKGDGPDA